MKILTWQLIINLIFTILTPLFTNWNGFIIKNQYHPIFCVNGYEPKNSLLIFLRLSSQLSEYSVLKDLLNDSFNNCNSERTILEINKKLNILNLKINNIKNYLLYLNVYKNINLT